MSLDPLTAAFDLGKIAIEKIWPDPVKRAQEVLKLETLKQTGDIETLNARVKLMLGQISINLKEAEHKSLFVAGWRPAVGWMCCIVMAFNYLGVYALEYAAMYLDFIPPVRMDMSDLWPVLVGMLGICSAARSFDKRNGVQTDRLGK